PCITDMMMLFCVRDFRGCASNQCRTEKSENDLTHGNLLFDFSPCVGAGHRLDNRESSERTIPQGLMMPCSPAHALAELRSGLNELSNPQRSRTDRAIHRRGNHGVGPVKCHLLFDCSGAIQLRVRTSTFLSAASDRIFRAATAR